MLRCRRDNGSIKAIASFVVCGFLPSWARSVRVTSEVKALFVGGPRRSLLSVTSISRTSLRDRHGFSFVSERLVLFCARAFLNRGRG